MSGEAFRRFHSSTRFGLIQVLFCWIRRAAGKNLPAYRRHPAAVRWQDATDTVSNYLSIVLSRFTCAGITVTSLPAIKWGQSLSYNTRSSQPKFWLLQRGYNQILCRQTVGKLEAYPTMASLSLPHVAYASSLRLPPRSVAFLLTRKNSLWWQQQLRFIAFATGLPATLEPSIKKSLSG